VFSTKDFEIFKYNGASHGEDRFSEKKLPSGDPRPVSSAPAPQDRAFPFDLWQKRREPSEVIFGLKELFSSIDHPAGRGHWFFAHELSHSISQSLPKADHFLK
jgi:hypothetical protein